MCEGLQQLRLKIHPMFDLQGDEVLGVTGPIWIGFVVEFVIIPMFVAKTWLDSVVVDVREAREAFARQECTRMYQSPSCDSLRGRAVYVDVRKSLPV